jgi:hypothetical protein
MCSVVNFDFVVAVIFVALVVDTSTSAADVVVIHGYVDD